MRIAIITGASSGMGMEFARQTDQGCLGLDEIWLIARRRAPMEALAGELTCKARIFPMDLTEQESYLPLTEALEREKPDVRLLINCAGYGKAKYFMETEPADAQGMIDLDCRALTQMTRLVIPYMPKRSFIIQLSSAAAFLPQPKFAVYAAAKSYVLSFSRALNFELKERGISVTAVCPGPVDTAFFARSGDGNNAPDPHKQTFMADKEKVVEKALKDAFAGKDISVYGLPMQMMQLGCKIFPHSLLISAYGKYLQRPSRYITLGARQKETAADQ